MENDIKDLINSLENMQGQYVYVECNKIKKRTEIYLEELVINTYNKNNNTYIKLSDENEELIINANNIIHIKDNKIGDIKITKENKNILITVI